MAAVRVCSSITAKSAQQAADPGRKKDLHEIVEAMTEKAKRIKTWSAT